MRSRSSADFVQLPSWHQYFRPSGLPKQAVKGSQNCVSLRSHERGLRCPSETHIQVLGVANPAASGSENGHPSFRLSGP
jgi:hypothetical protein